MGRSVWSRFFGEQVDDRYQAFANPSAEGHLLGLQTGFDLWRGRVLPGNRDVAGLYFAYGNGDLDANGLVTNTAASGYAQTQTGTL